VIQSGQNSTVRRMKAPAPINRELKITYLPTPEQSERAGALRRFNWLAVYAPLIVAGLIVIVLVALLLWGALSPTMTRTDTRAFASGLADIVLILAMLPLLLLCLIGPLLAGGLGYLAYQRRQQALTPGTIWPNSLHTLLWRLDRLLDSVQSKLRMSYLPKVANPLISTHARAAYIREWGRQLKKLLNRS
jgi:predicted PurR-regulated permease PerM